MTARDLFRKAFGSDSAASGFVPGRVNLIGEHTDYNGGMVLPSALSLGIDLALSPRTDGLVRMVADGFGDVVERRLSEAMTDHWSDYALGAVRKASDEGWLEGADIAATSTLPTGAGLSSSAAFLVNVLKRACEVAGASMPDVAIAKLARQVETDFIGVPCGIMDQMAVAIAEPGRALALDTHTLDYDVIPLPTDPVVAVLHSGVARKLSEGRYAERAGECAAVKELLGREDICRAPLSALDRLSDPTLLRRARHCVTEHQRTVSAAGALRNCNWSVMGDLMSASHASMRDDFAITTPAIDALVATCVTKGALGARMTGGGFGGCIVALVWRQDVDSWRERVLATHGDAYHVA